MSEQEFLKKIKELDPFLPKAATYNILYEHFETCVEEMGRLEDIEDDRIQMQACIDKYKDDVTQRLEQYREELSKLLDTHAQGSGKPQTSMVRMWELAYAIQVLEELKDEF